MSYDIQQIHDLRFRRFLSRTEIADRIVAIGKEVSADYQGKQPVIISILNGSFIFAADLLRTLTIDPFITFVKLSSYQGIQTTGLVSTVLGLDCSLKNKDVILLEDILDTGKTLYEFAHQLQQEHQPASLKIATLFYKPDAVQYPIQADYIGFSIPNIFVVGYGLDYNGFGRSLPDLYVLAEE